MSEVDAQAVLAGRRAERDRLLGEAKRYVDGLAERLPLRAAVVFGSVARGDFNRWSDVDLLLIVEPLPERWLERAVLLEPRPPGVQSLAWTPAEWHAQLARANPIVREACERGVWLRGSPELFVG